LKPDGQFEFKIFEGVQEMAEAIRDKAGNGYSARLVAGFCWPWSNPDGSGQLVDDVKLDGFSMPWNAMPDAGKLAPGIPKSNFWASDPNGINQVGCVYTAQGFEFDYVGVIFGKDLVYNGGWSGNRKVSHDNVVKRAKEVFVNLVKQTYRVPLTGCYVFFEDDATRDFFLSRITTKQHGGGQRLDDREKSSVLISRVPQDPPGLHAVQTQPSEVRCCRREKCQGLLSPIGRSSDQIKEFGESDGGVGVRPAQFRKGNGHPVALSSSRRDRPNGPLIRSF
jgi:DUF2075 family protein